MILLLDFYCFSSLVLFLLGWFYIEKSSNLKLLCEDNRINLNWNLNGLIAHDCIKIILIQAYITNQNFDIVCLSETFLNSMQSDDH